MLYNTTNGRVATILQLVKRQIHPQWTKICHIPTSWHVAMLGSGTAMWWICCTTSCRIVVSSSVGGVVQHARSRCPCSGVWHWVCQWNLVASFVRSFVYLLNNKANRNIYSSQHTQSKTTRLVRALMATLIIDLQYVVIMTFPANTVQQKNLKHTLKIHIKTL